MNLYGIKRECENITKVRYSWTGYWTPHGVSYGKLHWDQSKETRDKFLNVSKGVSKYGRIIIKKEK